MENLKLQIIEQIKSFLIPLSTLYKDEVSVILNDIEEGKFDSLQAFVLKYYPNMAYSDELVTLVKNLVNETIIPPYYLEEVANTTTQVVNQSDNAGLTFEETDTRPLKVLDRTINGLYKSASLETLSNTLPVSKISLDSKTPDLVTEDNVINAEVVDLTSSNVTPDINVNEIKVESPPTPPAPPIVPITFGPSLESTFKFPAVDASLNSNQSETQSETNVAEPVTPPINQDTPSPFTPNIVPTIPVTPVVETPNIDVPTVNQEIPTINQEVTEENTELPNAEPVLPNINNVESVTPVVPIAPVNETPNIDVPTVNQEIPTVNQEVTEENTELPNAEPILPNINNVETVTPVVPMAPVAETPNIEVPTFNQEIPAVSQEVTIENTELPNVEPALPNINNAEPVLPETTTEEVIKPIEPQSQYTEIEIQPSTFPTETKEEDEDMPFAENTGAFIPPESFKTQSEMPTEPTNAEPIEIPTPQVEVSKEEIAPTLTEVKIDELERFTESDETKAEDNLIPFTIATSENVVEQPKQPILNTIPNYEATNTSSELPIPTEEPVVTPLPGTPLEPIEPQEEAKVAIDQPKPLTPQFPTFEEDENKELELAKLEEERLRVEAERQKEEERLREQEEARQREEERLRAEEERLREQEEALQRGKERLRAEEERRKEEERLREQEERQREQEEALEKEKAMEEAKEKLKQTILETQLHYLENASSYIQGLENETSEEIYNSLLTLNDIRYIYHCISNLSIETLTQKLLPYIEENIRENKKNAINIFIEEAIKRTLHSRPDFKMENEEDIFKGKNAA